MGVLSSALNTRRITASADNVSWHEYAGFDLPIATATGNFLTEEAALRYSAVFACVRILAETVAELPLIVYERLEQGKTRATGTPLYRLLHDEPNPVMTSFEFREAMQGHLALWGNAYAEIEYNGAGRPVALWPLRPDRMIEVVKDASDQLVYTYQLPDGKVVKLPGYQVWHLRGLSPDGIIGYSPISLMRQAIGLGIAAEEFGARFFGNDARPGGVLQHPGVLGDDAAERLRRSWESRHGGLSRSHRVAILEEGMTYQQIGVPPEDAQFLETRKFQRSEIAGIFRIPPHMIGDLERATFSNIEHQSIEFVKYTLMPWLRRWEQGINMRLMMPRERQRYFAEFLVDGLLRGDIASRYQAYAVGRQNGWLSANDVREMENMNPVEGGDVYLVPLNMVPADSLSSSPANEPDTTPAPDAGGVVDTARSAEATERRVTLRNGAEIRASQMSAAMERNKLQQQYVGLWEDSAARLVRRETNDVLNAAKRLLKSGSTAELMDWIAEFYGEFEGVVARGFEPLMNTYAAQVAELAAKETEGATPAISGFIAAYLSELAGRYVGPHRSKLMALIEEFQENSLEEIDRQLSHWRETAPSRVARSETVRASNAVALAVYRSLGRSRKTWVTFGDNCPYCDSLGGRSLPIESYFIARGQEFVPVDGVAPLRSDSDVGHAPAHEGCNCQVVAA